MNRRFPISFVFIFQELVIDSIKKDAWIIAAEFYYQINPLISEKLLEKGLKHLPNSPELNSAFFITYCKNEDIRQNSVDYHQLILNLYNDCRKYTFNSRIY